MKQMITAQNALVRSAAVEIKTLTVSGKQLTLSVFRQIPYAELLDGFGMLNGPPWGWVNYWWNGDASWGNEALHVIWQEGDGLKRGCVPKPSAVEDFQRSCSSAITVERDEFIADWYDAACHAIASQPQKENERPVLYDQYFSLPQNVFNKRSLNIEKKDFNNLRAPQTVRGGMSRVFSGRPLDDWEKKRLEEAIAIQKEALPEGSYEECCDSAREHERRAIEIMNAWQSSYDACLASGQLFIAV